MLIHDLFPLTEARRKPEVNKKISALDALSKYAGRKDVFVTFTHDVGTASHGFKGDAHIQRAAVEKGTAHNLKGAKIGINPTSDYKTPLGIYSYPVDYVIDKKKQKTSVEFGGDRPYMWVFKPTGQVVDLATYTQADLDKTIKEISPSGYDRLLQRAAKDALVKTPGGYFWAITRNLALGKAKHKLETEAENGAEEREEKAWEDWLKYHEREFTRKEEYWDEDSEDWVEGDEDVFDEEACREAFRDQYEDDGVYVSEEEIEAAAALPWNLVFRKMGYSGVVDSKGEGIIHENEPTQAVFFSKNDIKVLELVDNINPEEPKTQEEIWYKQPKALLAAMRKGKVSEKQLLKLVQDQPFIIEKIGFGNLPENIKNDIRENAAAYFANWYGQMKPQEIGMNDEQTIKLFAHQPGWASTYEKFTPKVKAYVLAHAIDFKEYFDRLPLSDNEKLKAMQADGHIYAFINKQQPSQFLQDYMLKYYPDEVLGYIYSPRFSTETCVKAMPLEIKRLTTDGKTPTQARNYFLNTLANRQDNYDAFLACFKKITPAAALSFMKYASKPRWTNNKSLVDRMCAVQPSLKDFFLKTA